MEGPVQWAVLIFVASLAAGCMIVAWNARGKLAAYELKYDLAIAALSRAIEDRNFLIKYDLSIAGIIKDHDHLRANFKQHQIAAAEEHDDLIRAQAEVQRLGKIVNGKH